MDFEITATQVNYDVGRYFEKESGELYQIIHDKDRGYALLNVKKGMVTTSFEEDFQSFLVYTTITQMKPLKQISVARFES